MKSTGCKAISYDGALEVRQDIINMERNERSSIYLYSRVGRECNRGLCGWRNKQKANHSFSKTCRRIYPCTTEGHYREEWHDPV